MNDSIIADLKSTYGLTCYQITPVAGGLLNQKWRASTEKGDLLVKQFSSKRFTKDRIEQMEERLKRQIILEKCGVPCPFLWQYENRVIRWLSDETAYMVMDFCSGKTENSSTITLPQMRSLGSACAFMHKAFSQLPQPSDKELPVSGGYTIASLRETLVTRNLQCPLDAKMEYRTALLAAVHILHNLNDDFFNPFPKGFAHEDFHAGNILFHANCVSSIVDFDRNCYSYIWHDIGRAILSFALEGETINVKKVYAFFDGYTQHASLTLQNIADALRLTWCIETPWWVQPAFFIECDETPRRFRDEMLWLTEHWFELDAFICT